MFQMVAVYLPFLKKNVNGIHNVYDALDRVHYQCIRKLHEIFNLHDLNTEAELLNI